MKSFENLPPILGVPTAVFTITWTHLLFLPSFFINSALYQNPTVLVWLYAPGLLAVVLLVLTGLLGLWDVPVTNEKGIRKKQPLIEPYEWVIGKIERFYRPRVAGWKRGILRNIAIPAVVASLLVGIPTAGWATILGVVAIILNFFVLGGSVRREPTYVNAEGDSRPSVGIEVNLASALVEFYTKEADYRVKTEDGSFIDEVAREEYVSDRILEVEEVKPDVYKIKFRNDTTKSDEKFIKYLDEVSGLLELMEFERKDEDKRAGFVTVTFWLTERTDATSDASGLPMWHQEPGSDYFVDLPPNPKALPFGVDTDGKPVSVGLKETNLLIGGQPGSGKSVTLASIYAGLAQLPNVATLNFDPKQVELGGWADRASFNSVGECCFPIALEAIYNEMEARYTILKHRGLKKTTPEMWAEFPQIVLILDELAKVFSDPDDPSVSPLKTYNYHIVRKLIAEGRAAGISVITATQRPSADLVPTSMRNLIQQAVVHSMKRENDTKMVLGDIKDTKAHELLPSQKGVGYILNEASRVPTLFRTSLLLNNEERLEILNNPRASKAMVDVAENKPTLEEFVEATRHLRVALPCLDNNPAIQQHMEDHRLTEEARLRQMGLV